MMGYIMAVMKQNPPIDTSPGAMGTNASSFGQQPFPQQQQVLPVNPYAAQAAYGMQPNLFGQEPSNMPGGPMSGQNSKELEIVNKKIDDINDEFFQNSVSMCNNLISAKVKLHNEAQALKIKKDQLLSQQQQIDTQLGQA